MKRGRRVGKPGDRNWQGAFIRALILTMIWGGIFTAIFVAYCALDLPDIHEVTQAQRRPSITLEAVDGTVFARYGDLYGDRVTLKMVPKYLPQAIIAIEDRRFYSHFGVDVLGLGRALLRNLVAGHVVQGGSTITQQLAKNLFLTPERTMKRKVQEMMLALWLEHTYTKDQILAAYINRVYLGNGTYGVDAASRVYFGHPAREMNLRESAIIAGLLRAPSRYAPSRDPAQAMARAKMVLDAMVDEGYIGMRQRKEAVASFPKPERKPGSAGDGRYFADWVADQIEPLVEDTSQDIIVRTTLDLKLERVAEREVDQVLATQDGRDVSQGALITLSYDGAVRAMVGGRNYRESQFNRAVQAQRQPGSAFKPIVYLAAIMRGLKPDDIIVDEPIKAGNWRPENFDGTYRGPITVREALALSINTVAVRVFQKVGINEVIYMAQALGITSPLERDTTLALGSSALSPLELTSAYASIAAGGRAVTPYAIKQIRNREGEVLYEHPDVNLPRTVSESAVETLVDMMQDVVRYGTGKRAALGDRQVAGKTGTSSDYRDAWFLGFTGNYTTGVWLGNDDNRPMQKIVGGSLPAQLWHDYMMQAEAEVSERSLLSGPPSDWGGPSSISRSFGNFLSGIISGGSVEPSYPDEGKR